MDLTNQLSSGVWKGRSKFEQDDDDDDDLISMPLLPKYGIIANFNAAIVASVILMVMTALNDFHGNAKIYALGNLIPCFGIGVFVAVSSIVAGHFSVRTGYSLLSSQMRRPTLAYILHSSNLLFYTALCLMASSHAILAWSVYRGASIFMS